MTSVLAALQGMLGETYDRLLEGKAVSQTENPLYLPDDNKFHGMGKRAQYLMDSYWDTNHTFNLYNATSVPDSVLAMRLAHNLPPPSSTIFQDAANLTHTIIPPPPRCCRPMCDDACASFCGSMRACRLCIRVDRWLPPCHCALSSYVCSSEDLWCAQVYRSQAPGDRHLGAALCAGPVLLPLLRHWVPSGKS